MLVSCGVCAPVHQNERLVRVYTPSLQLDSDDSTLYVVHDQCASLFFLFGLFQYRIQVRDIYFSLVQTFGKKNTPMEPWKTLILFTHTVMFLIRKTLGGKTQTQTKAFVREL